MQRPIKFRAWDKHGKKMLYSYQPLFIEGFTGNMWLVPCAIDGVEYPRRDYADYPLMQYTGLHDRNGKEIYEGDILVYKGFAPNGWKAIGDVRFEYGGFLFIYKGGGYNHLRDLVSIDGDGVRKLLGESSVGRYLDLADTAEDAFEVVGNVYQTPELLNR